MSKNKLVRELLAELIGDEATTDASTVVPFEVGECAYCGLIPAEIRAAAIKAIENL